MTALAGDRQAERARAERRAYPVHFYSGRNGDGKTLTAVWDTLPTLDGTGAGLLGKPRPVLSTVRFLDYLNPRPCDGWEQTGLEPQPCSDLMHGRPDHMQAHPLYVPFRRWPQLLEWNFGDVVMDEVTGIADCDEGASLPAAVKNALPQLRRDDIAIRVTGHNWIRAHKRLRESVQAVTRCRGSRPVSRNHPYGQGRIFRPRRLIHQGTYDAQTLPVDDHTAAAYEKADRIGRGRLWVPTCIARLAYDTFAPVLTVGSVSDTGRCVYCDGTRRADECICPDYQQRRAGRKRAASRAVACHEHDAERVGRHAPREDREAEAA